MSDAIELPKDKVEKHPDSSRKVAPDADSDPSSGYDSLAGTAGDKTPPDPAPSEGSAAQAEKSATQLEEGAARPDDSSLRPEESGAQPEKSGAQKGESGGSSAERSYKNITEAKRGSRKQKKDMQISADGRSDDDSSNYQPPGVPPLSAKFEPHAEPLPDAPYDVQPLPPADSPLLQEVPLPSVAADVAAQVSGSVQDHGDQSQHPDQWNAIQAVQALNQPPAHQQADEESEGCCCSKCIRKFLEMSPREKCQAVLYLGVCLLCILASLSGFFMVLFWLIFG